MGVLERIGKGLVSFGTGTPQIELDRMALENESLEQSNQAGNVALKQQQTQISREQEMRRLQQAARTDPAAMERLMYEFPEVAQMTIKSGGLLTDQQQEQAEMFLTRYVNEQDPQRREQLALNRMAGLSAEQRDWADTADLLQMSPEQADMSARGMLSALRSQRMGAAGGTPAGVREMEAIANMGNFTSDEVEDQARVKAGLLPRAGESADERIAKSDELTAQVAESKAKIESAKKFASATAGQRADFIQGSTEAIFRLEQNVNNLQGALDAVDAGARPGPLMSKFPSLRAASVELDQIQAKLGLDVVGAVQFGALSKGELDLALKVAIPDNLRGKALKDWLIRRQAAQRKLIDFNYEFIKFLNEGGTPAEFMLERKEKVDKALNDAREAIEQGAPRDAVIQSLEKLGIDPGNL